MRFRIAPIDALLLLMTLIWGSNFSLIKSALREIPEHGFNALRLLIASAIFLAAITFGRLEQLGRVRTGRRPRRSSERGRPASSRISRRDRWALLGLAVIGHFLYQVLFMSGLARTSVANSSLIFACTPVVVALAAAGLGHERVGFARWLGAVLSLVGVYLVVGRGASVDAGSMAGDVMIFGAMFCWAVYTIGSGRLLARHSPLIVTGYSMALGSVMYAPLGLSDLAGLNWGSVSFGSWGALSFSAILGLVVAYLIWYTAVQRIGNTRTTMYSNMVPLAAIAVAAVWLGEPVAPIKLAGGAAILIGVAVTKLEPTHPPAGPATDSQPSQPV